jgi:diaminopimelate decarboxylase
MKWHGCKIQDNHLFIGGVSAVSLASQFGTPLFVMNEDRIRSRAQEFLKEARARWPQAEVAYASKAFCCQAMCALVNQEGLHLDVVSAGELHTALRAKFPAERIEFHGNNKSRTELAMALEHKVGRIICDSASEIELLTELCSSMGCAANVLIRLNPGVDPHTHASISTGNHDSKFGVPIADGQALSLVKSIVNGQHKGVRLLGFHCHVGSQLLELDGLADAANVMVAFAHTVKQQTGLEIEELNLGGGLGIRYLDEHNPPTIGAFFDALLEPAKLAIQKFGLKPPCLVFEPGRALVGDSGITLYEVGTIKKSAGTKKFVAVDGGMSDNPRPALYQAKYYALLANRAAEAPTEKVCVVGKSCESGDIIIPEIALPETRRGDYLAVFSTGAYNYSMASNYNRLPRPAVVFVQNGTADVVVRRESLEDIVSHDELPSRLSLSRS